MINTITPAKYSSANNPIILDIETDENFNEHQVIITITSNKVEEKTVYPLILTYTTVNGTIYSKYTYSNVIDNGKFIKSNTLFIDEELAIVIESTDTYFIIDRILNVDNAFASLILGQFKAPVLKSDVNKVTFNFKEFAKNLVNSSFNINKTESYESIYSVKQIRLHFHETYIYEWQFTDNYFVSGKLGFITSIPQPLLFAIGDRILIEQDLTEWTFSSISEIAGKVKLNGTDPKYTIGQSIQIVNSNIDGTYTIIDVDNVSVTIDLDYRFITTGGKTFSNARPSYDGYAIITAIQNGGNLIVTDKDWDSTSPIIGGRIRFYSKQAYKQLLFDNTTNKYNMDILDQSILLDTEIINDVNLYLIDNLYKINWSTILEQKEYEPANTFTFDQNRKLHSTVYPVNYEAKGQMLTFYKTKVNTDLFVTLFNNNKEVIGEFYKTLDVDFLNIGESGSMYIPYGLDNLLSLTGTVDAPFNDYLPEDIKFYSITLKSGNKQIIKTISFEIVDECKHDKIDLIFKDSNGSFIAFPFNKLSRVFMETDKKFYTTAHLVPTKTIKHNLSESQNLNGDIVYNSRNKYKYILNTDWIKEYCSDLIVDAVKSTETYLFNHTTKEYFRVNITQTTVEKKKMINDSLIVYTLEVEEAKNR